MHTVERKRVGPLHVLVADVALADAAVRGGASVVQIRLKSGTDRDRFRTAEAIARRCAGSATACIVNDRLDLALAVRADGVHLGADDLPVEAARRLAPPGFIVGASALGPTAAAVNDRIADVADHVDYVGVGPVYPTPSKPDIPTPMGEAELATVVRSCRLPLIAISGITMERVPALWAIGVTGIAVIGAVQGAADPVATVARLREMVGE